MTTRQELVSILTRPEGRVLPKGDTLAGRYILGFNPHPSRGAGATYSRRTH